MLIIGQVLSSFGAALSSPNPHHITSPRYRTRNRHPSFQAVALFFRLLLHIQDKMAAVNQVYIAIIGTSAVLYDSPNAPSIN